jgi:predicted DNA-binding transcriptional regulator AlpA
LARRFHLWLDIGEPEVSEWFANRSLECSPPEISNDTCSSTTSKEYFMPSKATALTRSTQEAINTLSPGDRRVLNENELAQRWGISPKTLQRWRCEGRGPKYLKLSKRVSYPLEGILDFEQNALHASTSERVMA